MKSPSISCASAFAAFVFTSLNAMPATANDTQGWYIGLGTGYVAVPGARFAVEKVGGGSGMRGETDEKGQAELTGLTPGRYYVDFDGKTLSEQIETVIVTAERKAEVLPGNSGTGGNGRRSSQSKSEAGGHFGASVRSSTGSSKSSRFEHEPGVGLYIDDKNSNPPTISASVVYDWNLGSHWEKQIAAGQMRYSRETAAKGMHLEFKIPEGGGPVGIALRAQWGHSRHNSAF